jgi:hypothetical protein
MPLEILDLLFVLVRPGPGRERAKIPALARFGIGLAGIEPELSGLQFANHGRAAKCKSNAEGK